MPKKSKAEIFEDEKKVMRALQQDARQSIDIIAKDCGFSRQKVWRIMKRLEDQKIIWGYHAVVEDDTFTHNRYYVLVKRTPQYVTDKTLDIITTRELKEKMEEMDIYLEDSHFIHGSYDWLLSMTAKDIRQVKKFTETFNKMFKDYVQKIDILEVIFPISKNGIQNPNVEDFKNIFI